MKAWLPVSLLAYTLILQWPVCQAGRISFQKNVFFNSCSDSGAGIRNNWRRSNLYPWRSNARKNITGNLSALIFLKTNQSNKFKLRYKILLTKQEVIVNCKNSKSRISLVWSFGLFWSKIGKFCLAEKTIHCLLDFCAKLMISKFIK